MARSVWSLPASGLVLSSVAAARRSTPVLPRVEWPGQLSSGQPWSGRAARRAVAQHGTTVCPAALHGLAGCSSRSSRAGRATCHCFTISMCLILQLHSVALRCCLRQFAFGSWSSLSASRRSTVAVPRQLVTVHCGLWHLSRSVTLRVHARRQHLSAVS